MIQKAREPKNRTRAILAAPAIQVKPRMPAIARKVRDHDNAVISPDLAILDLGDAFQNPDRCRMRGIAAQPRLRRVPSPVALLLSSNPVVRTWVLWSQAPKNPP